MTVNNQTGFSLVELEIVIMIIAILALIAIPTLIGRLPQNRLNGAARQIMGDLMWARSEAVSQQNKFKIYFLDNHRYRILDDDNNNNLIDPNEWITEKDIQDQYHDVIFAPIPIKKPIFNPRGTASSFTTIYIKNSSGMKKIVIDIAGRVKIE